MVENIIRDELQCIADNLEDLISNMQINVANYKKQQTILYWTNIRMSNNIQIYKSDIVADMEALNTNIDDLMRYTEKIICFAEDILKEDMKKIQECSEMEVVDQYVNIIQEKMNVLLLFVTKHSEEQAKYAENVLRVKDKMERHHVPKKKTLWKRICERI